MRTSISISTAIFLLILSSYFAIDQNIAKASTPIAEPENDSSESVDKQQGSNIPHIVPGVVLVRLKSEIDIAENSLGIETSDTSLGEIFRNLGIENIESVFGNLDSSAGLNVQENQAGGNLSHTYRLHFSPDINVLHIVESLREDPNVIYAEPDYLAHIISTPNDPLYSGQWGVAQIEATTAWDVITGTTDIVIAVVDSGIDNSHPDLTNQLWVNPGEIAGNGLDDDSNGYVDDINGWNILDNSDDLSDNTGHGTQVAGIIAAVTNNSLGVSGLCWNCRLMTVKVIQPGGAANYSDIATGIIYAAEKGAKVINLSLGGYSDSITLRAAIETASQTSVIVGGTGNDSLNEYFYPAAYNDYVLAVGGTTDSDTKVNTSNYGTWVDVSAPGEIITTTFSGGGYGATSGTSMAAPFASGLAGLLRSLHPDWSANMVRSQIIHTTDNIDSLNPGYEQQLGTGRINANLAVNTTAQPLLNYQAYAVDGETNGRPEPGSTVDLTVTLYNEWADVSNIQATLSTTDPYVTIINGTAAYGSIGSYQNETNKTPFRFSISSSAPYAHDIPFILSVIADGGYAITIPFTLMTANGTEYVSGVIATDTVWTGDKEYVVTGNVLVQSGITLTIEAGTIIRFDRDKTLLINGTLVATGQSDLKIRFTSNETEPSPGNWTGIKFGDSSTDAIVDGDYQYLSGSTLQQTIIEYATTGILCANASPYLGNNLVRFNSNIGIMAGESAAYYDSRPVVAYNQIEQNSNGLQTGNALAIINNRVVDNSGFGIFADRGGDVYPGMLSRNLIAGNNGDGLNVWASKTFSITKNTIIGNQIGVNLDGGGPPLTFIHNNLLENAQFNFKNSKNFAVNIPSNWWGTTNTSIIDQKIYDFADNFSLGVVNYTPFLTSIPDAPAYLHKLEISPPSPVGIQQANFILTFSRSMEQSINPIVTFGATEPYTSFVVSDNAQWLNDRVWSATFDVTSLIPRDTYTISVSGIKDSNGMEIVADKRFGFTVDYAGQITDQTPPNPPGVFASGSPSNPSYVEASWIANDVDSIIINFRYAIGLAPGTTDIIY